MGVRTYNHNRHEFPQFTIHHPELPNVRCESLNTATLAKHSHYQRATAGAGPCQFESPDKFNLGPSIAYYTVATAAIVTGGINITPVIGNHDYYYTRSRLRKTRLVPWHIPCPSKPHIFGSRPDIPLKCTLPERRFYSWCMHNIRGRNRKLRGRTNGSHSPWIRLSLAM